MKWHDPKATFAEGIAQPRRPPDRPGHRAGVARRRHVPGVERALRARPLARRHARRGPRPRLVRHPPPHPRRGAALGPHRGRPARRFPLGRLAGGAGRARAPRLPVDSVLRLRGVHRLRPRARGGVAARARGRIAGHRPGPEPVGRRRPGPFLGTKSRGAAAAPESRREPAREGRRREPGPAPVHEARQGPLDLRTATSPARSSGRSASSQLPLAFTEGFSPRPKVSFGLALSTGHESDAEYLDLVFADDVDLDAAAGADSPRRCPTAWRSSARSPLAERAPALQEAVTVRRVAGRRRARRRSPSRSVASSRAQVDAALGSARAPDDAAAQGPRRRRGRAARHPSHHVCDAPTTTNPVTRRDGNVHPTAQREAGRRTRCDRRRSPTLSSRRCARTNGSSATARGRSRSTPTRARVCRRHACHERRHRCQI